jgi:hypothetical protein
VKDFVMIMALKEVRRVNTDVIVLYIRKATILTHLPIVDLVKPQLWN